MPSKHLHLPLATGAVTLYAYHPQAEGAVFNVLAFACKVRGPSHSSHRQGSGLLHYPRIGLVLLLLTFAGF